MLAAVVPQRRGRGGLGTVCSGHLGAQGQRRGRGRLGTVCSGREVDDAQCEPWHGSSRGTVAEMGAKKNKKKTKKKIY